MTAHNAILTNGGFRCRGCGTFEPAPVMRVYLRDFIGRLGAFNAAHAECRVEQPATVEAGRRPAVPAFKRGDKVVFPYRNKDVRGTVEKVSTPAGLDVLIKYHGGNFIWRKAAFVRLAEQPETASKS